MTSSMIAHAQSSLNAALNMDSKLSDQVLNMDGMSGKQTRHFYNRIGEFKIDSKKTNYLEVGTWKGSSLISMAYKNSNLKSTVIDNWSEFGGPKDAFFENCKTMLTDGEDCTVLDGDCFAVELPLAQLYDIYMYDGEHSRTNQKRAITHFWPYLAKSCIIIVDDWNWPDVRNGTFDGFAEVGANIAWKKEIRHTDNDSVSKATEEFWNGIGIFVVEKNI